MKSRKLLFTLVLTLVALLMFTVSICAEIVEITKEDAENVYANESNYRKDHVWNIIDGNKETVGIYSDGNDWFGVVGDTLTIEFKYEIYVTNILAYGAGNWTESIINCYDKDGNLTLSGQTILNGNTGQTETPEPYIVFDYLDSEAKETKAVKKMVITITALKWNGNIKTHKYSELSIFHDHVHDYVINDGLIYPPTCAVEGRVRMKCVCGDVSELPVEPTGNHSFVDKVVFRNGFTNPGYYGAICETCDTQDYPETHIDPLFTSLGYSSSTYNGYSIQIGIMINYEAIELYNSLAPYPIDFGVVAASQKAYSDGNPLSQSEAGIVAAASTVICKSLTDNGSYLINYKIKGFGEENVDTQFFLSLYVFDGTSIYYIGEETTFDAITRSYTDITKN